MVTGPIEIKIVQSNDMAMAPICGLPEMFTAVSGMMISWKVKDVFIIEMARSFMANSTKEKPMDMVFK